MTEIETKKSTNRASWLRRVVLGTAFAAIGMTTLGAATTPAQAYWYGYGPAPYYYFHPHYYGWYGYYPAYYGGWGYGWHGGWHRGWRHW